MKLFCKKGNLITALVLIICNLTAHSQSGTDSVKLLREIIVTRNVDKSELRAGSPFQIFDNENLTSLNALQISDAVKHFSGVTVKDYGGIGGLKTISVRGLGANHTSVAYDGVAISDVQTGQIDIGRFSLDNVEYVSLNIGQEDNIFQPARMFSSASVLQIRTQKPNFGNHLPINGKIGLRAGSFGLINPAFSIHGKISSVLSASFCGEWLSAHGRYPFILNYGVEGKDSSSLEKRKNTDVKNLRLEGTLYADFSAKSSGTLKTYYFDSQRGLPGAIIFYNDKSNASQRLSDKSFFTQGNFRHRFSNQWAMQANAKYNYSRVNYLDTAWLSQSQKLENKFIQRELYGSLSALYRVSGFLSFSASSDVSLNEMEANLHNFAYPTRFTSLSSLAARYSNHRVAVTGSLLGTVTSESVKYGTPADNHHKLSPFVSFTVKPFHTADFRIRAFYKNIFRLPTFNDLYYLRTGFRKLKPEDAHQLNVGITHSFSADERLKTLTLTVDAYHNRIKNKIVAKPSASLFEWTMLNYGSVYINGLDISSQAQIIASKNISVETGVNYTFQQATDRTEKTGRTYGHQLPYTPFHSGSGRINVKNPLVNVAYSMIWSGVRYSNFQNYSENRLPPYSDHSISIYKSFDICYLIVNTGIELQNIFNKNYEVISGFPMPGRSFRVNLSINF